MGSGGREQLDFNLFPKQREFLTCTERMVLYCGGTGAGKTHALIVKLFIRASVPGAREGLARKINADIPSSFLKDWQALIPSHLYSLHKHEQTITIHGGGEVQYFGCDEPERLGSRQLTGCAVEEATQIDADTWGKIDSIVRLPHPSGNQIYGCCNPGSPHHWMYGYFGVDGITPPNRRYIRTIVQDGFLGQNPSYVAAMAAKTGIDKKRRYEASWCDATGCIFENFTDSNIDERPLSGRCVLFVDDGDSAPFVCLKAYPDKYKRLHIHREVYRKGIHSLDDKADLVEKMMDADVEAVVVDMQALALIEALRLRGLPAVKSKKGAGSVEQGIARIRTLLEPGRGEDKSPRLTISEKCVNTIREFRTWAYTDAGEPGRDNNHALDAMRYGVMYLHLGAEKPPEDEAPGVGAAPTTAEVEHAEEWDWGRGDSLNIGIWG